MRPQHVDVVPGNIWTIRDNLTPTINQMAVFVQSLIQPNHLKRNNRLSNLFDPRNVSRPMIQILFCINQRIPFETLDGDVSSQGTDFFGGKALDRNSPFAMTSFQYYYKPS